MSKAIDQSDKINLAHAEKLVEVCFAKNKVPYLAGSPGLGKSALGMSIAKRKDYVYIDVRLAQADPTDLNVA